MPQPEGEGNPSYNVLSLTENEDEEDEEMKRGLFASANKLLLRRNHLGDVCALKSLQHLTLLDLQDNLLTDKAVAEGLSSGAYLPLLQVLNLAKNRLTHVPDLVLPNLVALVLNHNTIGGVVDIGGQEKGLAGLAKRSPRLNTLVLSHNSVTDIIGILTLRGTLVKLSASYNKIKVRREGGGLVGEGLALRGKGWE